MKILIIGGNRFVGADIVSRAVLEGHKVTVAALDPPNIRARSHVNFVRVDRNSPENLAKGLKGLEFDAVLDNIAFKPEHIEILLEVLKGKVGRYVLTSTVDIYPRKVTIISSEEDEQLSPSEITDAPQQERYLRGKRGCEKALRASGVAWAVIRPAIIYGRGDPVPPAPRNLHGIDTTYGRSLFFPSRVVDGGPILLRRSDRRVFRLASSQDVASGLLLIARHPDAEGKVFNVAGDEIWTSERLIRAIGEAAGRHTEIVRAADEDLDSAGLGDYDSPYGRIQWWSIADNRRLKSLGWSPTPASVQLTKLVEAALPLDKRPFYGRRMQEIALARKIMRRRQSHCLHSAPLTARKVQDRAEKKSKSYAPPMKGSYSDVGAEKWKKNLADSSNATPAPHENNFRIFQGRIISSIGLGTHRGEVSAKTDKSYSEALINAVKGGVNLIDTGINYRWMRAERTVRKVLAGLEKEGLSREGICLCTKGGFVPQDADDKRPLQEYIWEEFVAPGLIDMNEALLRHTLKAGFIRKLLGFSLRNLGVEHIDVYFVHNPERALAWMGSEMFYENLRETLIMLEEAVAEGKIGCYGIATWEGFRTSPKNPKYLSLEQIFSMAHEVGGSAHHFRAIQFPLNAYHTEALIRKNQEVSGRKMTLLEAASTLGLYTFASASVYRGKDFPPEVAAQIAFANEGLDPVQAALNWTRSAPGIGSALIGVRKKIYSEKALLVAHRPVLPPEIVRQTVERSDQ